MNWLINIALNINLNLPLFFFTLTFKGNTLWMCSLLVSCTTPKSRVSSTDFVINSIWFTQFFEFFCSLWGGGVEFCHCILYPCWMTDRTKESFVVLRHMLIWDLRLPGMNGSGPSCFEFFTCGRYRPRGSLLTFSKVNSVLRKCNHFIVSHLSRLRRVMRPLRVLQAHDSAILMNSDEKTRPLSVLVLYLIWINSKE